MKKINVLLNVVFAFFIISCNRQPQPPVAEKIPHEVFDNRIDNYFWMRLSDEQKSAATPDEQTSKVLTYLTSENSYKKEIMKHTENFQKTLYDEITGRIKKDDESVPYFENGYFYYTKYSEGKEYPVYYRKNLFMDGQEEVLLDVNKLAEGQEYCSVGGLAVSRDNKLLAYSVDTVSRRRYTLYFLDHCNRKPSG